MSINFFKKEWFVRIDEEKEGPFSINDLRADSRITPDTPAWKKGFSQWLPIRNIPELQVIFEDEETIQTPNDLRKSFKKLENEEIALDWRDNNPYFFYLLIVLAILFAYLIYEFN